MRGGVWKLECIQGELRTALKKVSFSKTSRTCITQMYAFFRWIFGQFYNGEENDVYCCGCWSSSFVILFSVISEERPLDNLTSFEYYHLSGRRRPRLLFKRKVLKLRRGRPVFRVRIGGRTRIYRKIGRRMRIKCLGRWRRLKFRRNRWKVKIGTWRGILRRGRRWYVRNKKRLIRLPRTPSTLQIRLHRRYRPVMVRGRRYFVKFGRRYRVLRRKFTWFARYKGRKLTVKRKGRLGFVRYRGKLYRGRRLRFIRRWRGTRWCFFSLCITLWRTWNTLNPLLSPPAHSNKFPIYFMLLPLYSYYILY